MNSQEGRTRPNTTYIFVQTPGVILFQNAGDCHAEDDVIPYLQRLIYGGQQLGRVTMVQNCAPCNDCTANIQNFLLANGGEIGQLCIKYVRHYYDQQDFRYLSVPWGTLNVIQLIGDENIRTEVRNLYAQMNQ